MSLVGANVAVAKILAETLPIAMVACLRCAIAVVVLVPLVRLFDPPVRPSASNLRNLAWQALFGTALYNAGLLAGLRLTTALEAGLVLATLPAVVAIGGAVWLRERLPPRQWLAVPWRSSPSRAWVRTPGEVRSAMRWSSPASAERRCMCCSPSAWATRCQC